MKTQELIGLLSNDLRPVSRWTIARRLYVGLAVGALASGLLVVAGLGLRPDLAEASRTPEFWIKLTYSLAMSAIGLWIANRAVRPAGEASGRAPAVLVPLFAVFLAATVQSTVSDPATIIHPLLMGSTASLCPWLVILCSIAPLAGLTWAARGCAPTYLSQAGAAIGLAAGGMGAALYSLHCTEEGLLFLGAWYTLGLVGVAVIASALANRLFHW